MLEGSMKLTLTCAVVMGRPVEASVTCTLRLGVAAKTGPVHKRASATASKMAIATFTYLTIRAIKG